MMGENKFFVNGLLFHVAIVPKTHILFWSKIWNSLKNLKSIQSLEAMSSQQTHRPGSLKLINKKHKTGAHRSKSAVVRDVCGRFTFTFRFWIRLIFIGKIDSKSVIVKKRGKLSRQQRKEQRQQIRAHKQEKLMAIERAAGANRAPLLTVSPFKSFQFLYSQFRPWSHSTSNSHPRWS